MIIRSFIILVLIRGHLSNQETRSSTISNCTISSENVSHFNSEDLQYEVTVAFNVSRKEQSNGVISGTEIWCKSGNLHCPVVVKATLTKCTLFDCSFNLTRSIKFDKTNIVLQINVTIKNISDTHENETYNFTLSAEFVKKLFHSEPGKVNLTYCSQGGISTTTTSTPKPSISVSTFTAVATTTSTPKLFAGVFNSTTAATTTSTPKPSISVSTFTAVATTTSTPKLFAGVFSSTTAATTTSTTKPSISVSTSTTAATTTSTPKPSTSVSTAATPRKKQKSKSSNGKIALVILAFFILLGVAIIACYCKYRKKLSNRPAYYNDISLNDPLHTEIKFCKADADDAEENGEQDDDDDDDVLPLI